eukprot:scaffold41487_cov100-Cyclotella_meneghiniana.AAC.4
MRSDANALLKIRDSQLIAMNRYGMIMAKTNMASTSLEYKNVLWVAPARRSPMHFSVDKLHH